MDVFFRHDLVRQIMFSPGTCAGRIFLSAHGPSGKTPVTSDRAKRIMGPVFVTKKHFIQSIFYLPDTIITAALSKFKPAANRHTAVTPRIGINNVLTSRAPSAAPM